MYYWVSNGGHVDFFLGGMGKGYIVLLMCLSVCELARKDEYYWINERTNVYTSCSSIRWLIHLLLIRCLGGGGVLVYSMFDCGILLFVVNVCIYIHRYISFIANCISRNEMTTNVYEWVFLNVKKRQSYSYDNKISVKHTSYLTKS